MNFRAQHAITTSSDDLDPLTHSVWPTHSGTLEPLCPSSGKVPKKMDYPELNQKKATKEKLLCLGGFLALRAHCAHTVRYF